MVPEPTTGDIVYMQHGNWNHPLLISQINEQIHLISLFHGKEAYSSGGNDVQTVIDGYIDGYSKLHENKDDRVRYYFFIKRDNIELSFIEPFGHVKV